MIYLVLISSLAGFLVSLVSTPLVIRFLRHVRMVVKDMHKEEKPEVPVSGGLAVIIGFFSGVMVYISLKTFLLEDDRNLAPIFASIISVLISGFIGFMDDLSVRLMEKGHYEGLKQWHKPLLTLFAAIPLMVINAGESDVYVPFLGRTDLGLFYPLIILPIGFVGATNMVNLLEGFNGLGTGMALVYTLMLGLFAFTVEREPALLFALVTFGSLLGFFFFNKVPAKILPGDSLTYMLGAVLGVIAIVGNLEKVSMIVSIPFFIEFVLKLRGRFQKQSYGQYREGKIHSLYDRVYSLPHLFTRTGRFTEGQIVFSLVGMEFLISLLIWIL